MKYWTARKIAKGANVPGKVSRIAHVLEASFAKHGDDAPTLLRIGRQDDENRDCHRWEVDVELTPGVVLPIEYGLVESMNEEWDDLATDEEGVVGYVIRGVEACMPMLGRLSTALHDIRVTARAAVAAWSEHGLTSRVADVHLAPYEHWQGNDKPEFRVSIDSLDDRLEPTVETIETWTEQGLPALLEEVRAGFAYRKAARDRLAGLGATGDISQLALNAIGEFGDTAAALRRFQSEWRFWLPDDTAIVMTNGEVNAGNGSSDLDAAVQWQRNGVSIAEHLVPDRDLAVAVGRPVTDLIEHDYLSSDMKVLKTSWTANDLGRRWLFVELAMPRRLFCSVSGRVWDPAETAPEGGNVVPFAKRA